MKYSDYRASILAEKLGISIDLAKALKRGESLPEDKNDPEDIEVTHGS